MKRLMLNAPLLLVPVLLAACKAPLNAELTGVPIEFPKPEVPVFEPVRPSDAKPVPKGKERYKQTANLQGQGQRKMDILFVIDDSESMCGDQRTVSNNINRFVDVFLANKKIDFQIGVTSSWDSRLFGNAKRKFQNGELRPVVGQASDVRFVTNSTRNLKETLKKSINIGFLKYNKNSPETSGSENEEFFSPILAAFSPEMLSGPNKGFSRPDADKGVIIITDAEDGTPDPTRPGQTMLASDVSVQLGRMVNEGFNFTVLAALARFDEMTQYYAGKNPGLTNFKKKFANGVISNCNSYSIDPGITDPMKGPAQLAELVRLNKGVAFDLQNKEFGTRMAELGQRLVKRSLSYKITLDRAADVSEPMVVKLNGKVLKQSDADGWAYDADNNQIVLSETLDLSNLNDFQVDIEYTILD